MFKPSLRRTVLKQGMNAHQTKNNYVPSSISNESNIRINSTTFIPFHKPKTKIPSMLIPQQLLQNKKFSNNKNYTHTISPLSYDFQAYPQLIKQMIKYHFKQVQIGVSQQIFYATYDQKLYLWKENKGSQINVRQHKFKQKIELIKVFTIKNPLLFKADQLSILAISFQNRVELFSIDQKDLLLTDLMIKYKIASASKISKIQYTSKSELIICGNNGQLCMISFSTNKQLVVKIDKSPLKKYISKSSFDYYSQCIAKQVAVFNNFVYCLTQKHMKTNILLYSLKKLCSFFIGGKVQQLTQKTYIDIYKLNEARTSMVYVDRLDQKQIQDKIKTSYANYSGEQIQQGFKIASLVQRNIQIDHKKQTTYKKINILHQQNLERMEEQVQNSLSEDQENQQKVASLIFTQNLTFITRCGYAITIKHRDCPQIGNKQKSIAKNIKKKIIHNFTFSQEPFKIFQNFQKIALVDTIQIKKNLYQKQSRKNFVITSKGFNNLTIMSDMIVYFGDKSIGVINAIGIKPIIFQRSKKVTQKPESYYNQQEKYYEIQNLQRQWIVFNNEGHQKIYLLEPRHLLLSYLYFKCQTSYQSTGQKNPKSLYVDKVLDFDDNFHKITQKMIKIYGYYQFNKMIIQLLINLNQVSNNQVSQKTQTICIQQQIIQNLINLQVTQQKYRAFEDWFYELGTYKALKILQTQRISFYLWTLLMEYQYQPILNTQFQESQKQIKGWVNFYQQFESDFLYTKRYSSYGYALKSIFYNTIEPIINLKAKQYKQKYLQIKQVEDKLKILLSFLQQKHLKEQDNRYKHYSVQKKDRFNEQKLKQVQKNKNKSNSKTLGNDSISTNYTNQSLIMNMNQIEGAQFNSQNQVYIEKSISETEDKIYKSIQKILILIQVFSKLIQSDQRARQGQQIPSFGEVMTNYKYQIILAQAFFNQQCSIIFLKQNAQNRGIMTNVFNSKLMKDIQLYLPQLQISDKIKYMNFKKAKNILWLFQQNSSLEIPIDLKSLDMESLAQITNSSHILQMRMLFIGRREISKLNDILFSQGRFQKYLQFIVISIRKIMQRHDCLFNIQRTYSQNFRCNKPNYLKAIQETIKRENEIVMSQQTQYLQKEIQLFYEELKVVFTAILTKFNESTGKQYYILEKALEFATEIIVKNCYQDQLIMQFLEHGLKQYKLIQKVMRMKKMQQKIKANTSIQFQKVIVTKKSLQLDEVKEFIKQNQLSTMQMYLKMSIKTGNTQQTSDTLNGLTGQVHTELQK